MTKTLLLLFLTILFFACKPIKPIENIFDFWWNEMNCKYPFFVEKNIDWDSVYNVYYEQTRNINESDLQIVFQEIFNLLKDGHCWVEAGKNLIYCTLQTDTIDKFFYYDITNYTDIQKITYSDDSAYYLVQLKNKITYINYRSFWGSINIDEFKNIISNFSYSKGIIFDIRQNGGGQSQNIAEWASCFFTGEKTLWSNKHKIGCGHSDFTDLISQKAAGNGFLENIPLAVLTSGQTYSAANYFAGVVKYFPNVVLIGTKTGGGGSWRTVSLLPNGWLFAYPVAKSYDIENNSMESGLEPTIKISATPEWYANHYDIVLETAFNYLINK
ncbi:MAG: S41 family peptidase [Prevotellaceae bacterium]|nr:S41 family peptidase [Prevotellaceae bacterium]